MLYWHDWIIALLKPELRFRGTDIAPLTSDEFKEILVQIIHIKFSQDQETSEICLKDARTWIVSV